MDTFSPLSEISRIRWQCRRGMLELDILLLSFFDKAYQSLSLEQKKDFVELLTFSDQTLYSWLIGQEQPERPALQEMVRSIREQQLRVDKA